MQARVFFARAVSESRLGGSSAASFATFARKPPRFGRAWTMSSSRLTTRTALDSRHHALAALADGSSALEDVAGAVQRLSIPVIVLGEFLFGIRRSRHRERYADWLGQLMEVSTVLDIDQETATQYSKLREALRRRGRPIPSNDAWIAALALQHDLAVLSRDGHFDEVAGVRRLGW